MPPRYTPAEFLDSIRNYRANGNRFTAQFVQGFLVPRLPAGYSVAAMGAFELSSTLVPGVAPGVEVSAGRIWSSTGQAEYIVSGAVIVETGNVSKHVERSVEVEVYFIKGDIPDFKGPSFQGEFTINPFSETANAGGGFGVNIPRSLDYDFRATWDAIKSGNITETASLIAFMDAAPPGFAWYSLAGTDNGVYGLELNYTGSATPLFARALTLFEILREKARPPGGIGAPIDDLANGFDGFLSSLPDTAHPNGSGHSAIKCYAQSGRYDADWCRRE